MQWQRIFFLLFFLLLFTYTTFKYYVSDPMAAARTALGLALITEWNIQIDTYAHFTNDKIFRDGHFYACQAPGTSFLALPTMFLAYYTLKAMGQDDFTSFDLSHQPPKSEERGVPSKAFGTVMLAGTFVVSFFAALGASLIYVFGIHFGTSHRVAVLVALFFGLGTPYAMWATVLMGHALAAAFLLMSYIWGAFLIQEGFVKQATTRWLLAGFLLAFSANIEYTAAIPAIILGLTLLVSLRRTNASWSRCRCNVFLLVLGAVPAAIFFFAYNFFAFGSPLSLGYQQVTDEFPLMANGFVGVTTPKFFVLLKTLFSPRFGILWFSPMLILFPFAVVVNLRRGFQRELNFACLLIVSYYFLLNSSYEYWFHSLNGPRHVTASLPFVFLPFLSMEQWPSPWLRRAVWILGGYSLILFSFVLFIPLSAIYWEAYSKIPAIIAAFFRGEIRNMFYYIGLPVWASMVLPFLIWAFFGYHLWREVRRAKDGH